MNVKFRMTKARKLKVLNAELHRIRDVHDAIDELRNVIRRTCSVCQTMEGVVKSAVTDLPPYTSLDFECDKKCPAYIGCEKWIVYHRELSISLKETVDTLISEELRVRREIKKLKKG